MSGPLSDVRLVLVDSFEELENFARWLGQSRPVLGLDTETEGLDWWRHQLRMIQVGDADTGWAFPAPAWSGPVIDLLRRYAGPLVLHNAKFDAHSLRAWTGFEMPWARTHDTLAMAHLIYPGQPAGLKRLAHTHVDARLDGLEKTLSAGMTKHKWTWATVPYAFEPYWQYGALDPVLTCRLAEVLWPQVQPFKELYETEIALSGLLQTMERHGFLIDRRYCIDQRLQLQGQADQLSEELTARWGISPSSPKQLASLFIGLGVPLSAVTNSGGWAMDEAALTAIDHPLAKDVLKMRGLYKTANTYFSNFIDFAGSDDRIHASVKQTGARTGRMSVGRPSLQNIPRSRATRWPFMAGEGRSLVLADYQQVEMRIMAHYAEEPGLIEAIKTGVDLHTFTAQGAFATPTPTKAQRQVAKSANFAKIYGAGPATFANTAGISLAEAITFLNGYDLAFPGVSRFMNLVGARGRYRAALEGEAYVITWGGRRLVTQRDAVYKLVNYLIQGSARDVLGVKMLALADAGLEDYMVLSVHDEVIFEVPTELVEDASQTIAEVMPDTESFKVPLGVDIEVAQRWGEKYPEGT